MKRLLVLVLFAFSLHAADPTKAELQEAMRHAFEQAEQVPVEQRRALAMSYAWAAW